MIDSFSPRPVVKAPLFSIVVPAHNRAHLLPRAISSVLSQSIPEFELIIVDDGSTDSTREIMRQFADPRIHYVHQENAGAAAARNRGARLCTGQFLTFLDSDDEATPGWLASFHEGFVTFGADIVCCGLERSGTGPEVEANGRVNLPDDLGPMFGYVVGRFTNGGVFAMRREIFDEVGGYAVDLPSGQHTELAMRLIPLAQQRGWTIHSIMQPLVRVHIHPGPRIRTNPEAIYLGSAYCLRVHRNLYNRDPRGHAKWQAVAGVNALRIRRYRDARHHFIQAVLADPIRMEHWGRLILSLAPSLAHRRWKAGGSASPQL